MVAASLLGSVGSELTFGGLRLGLSRFRFEAWGKM